MKLKKLWLGLAVALGIVLTGQQQAQAATNIVPSNDTYFSNNQALPIYSDSELHHNTGEKLSTAIADWQVFQTVINEAGQRIAVNLGTDQWVSTFTKPTYVEALDGSYIFKEAFSGGQAIQLYSDSALTKPLRKLDTHVSNWAITHFSFRNQADIVYSIDLGNNEWASIEAFSYVLPKLVRVNPNNNLVNEDGIITGHVADTGMSYKTFGVKYINGEIFVNLGDNNQWISEKQIETTLV